MIFLFEKLLTTNEKMWGKVEQSGYFSLF